MRSACCYGTTAPQVSPVSRRPCVPCHPHSSKVPPLQRPGMVPDNRPVPSDLPSEKWPTILPLQDNLLGPGASAQVWRGAWHSTISGGIWHSAIATIKEAGGMYHESHINIFVFRSGRVTPHLARLPGVSSNTSCHLATAQPRLPTSQSVKSKILDFGQAAQCGTRLRECCDCGSLGFRSPTPRPEYSVSNLLMFADVSWLPCRHDLHERHAC